MAKLVFEDYSEVEEKMMEGFTVAEVQLGINAMATGMSIELEREIDNVVLGIDILYDPDNEELETPLMVSQEYVKRIQ